MPTVAEDTQGFQIDVTANDIDDQGAIVAATISAVGSTGDGADGMTDQGGTVVIVDNQVAYTPPPHFFGVDTFVYTAIDGASNIDAGIVTITVTPVNDAPEPQDDDAEVTAVTVTIGNVLDNDADPDDNGAPGSVEVLTVATIDGQPILKGGNVTLASGAVVSLSDIADLNGNFGELTYDPNGRFAHLGVGQSTVDVFSYTVTDDEGEPSGTATVTITITGVNDQPTPGDDNAETDEDSTVTIDLLQNDSDPDDNDIVLTVALGINPEKGEITFNGDGTVTFDPNGEFEDLAVGEFEEVSFTYILNDTRGEVNSTAIGTATVRVNGVNDAPSAQNDDAVTTENQPVIVSVLDDNGSGSDSDVDADPLTVTEVTQPVFAGGLDNVPVSASFGSVEITGGGTSVTFNPGTDFDYLPHDGQALVSFTYTISDGNGGSDTATVTITIDGENDSPVVGAQNPVFIQKGVEVDKVITLVATDVDLGDVLTFTVNDGARGTVTNPENDATFTYAVTDTNTEFYNGNAGPQADIVAFTVTDDSNDGPERADEPDSADGTVSVTYRDNQPAQLSGLTHDAPNEVSTFEPFTAETDGNGDPFSITFNAQGTDLDDPTNPNNGVDSNIVSVVWTVNGQPVDAGDVTTNNPGGTTPATSSFVYTTDGFDEVAHPDVDNGGIVVRVEFTDGQGGTSSQEWVLRIDDVDRPTPTASVSVAPAAPESGDDVTAVPDPAIGDTALDPDGDEIVDYDYEWTNGDTTLDGDVLDNSETKKGETWTLNARAITDPYGDAGDDVVSTEPAAVFSFTVGNTAPTATADDVVTPEDPDQPFAIQLAGVDRDVDDGIDELVFNVTTQPEHGTLTFDPATGLVQYTPDTDFFGDDSFAFTVSDQVIGSGSPESTSAPATVTITVTPVNDAPVAYDGSGFTKVDAQSEQPIIIRGTDVDDDNGALTFFLGTDPGNAAAFDELGTINHPTTEGGTVTLNTRREGPVGPADVSFELTYTPPSANETSSFRGVDSFYYVVRDDDDAESQVAIVRITVGTPLWYPFVTWDEIDGADGTEWYTVSMFEMNDAREDGGSTTPVFTTNVNGTELTVVEYFAAGFNGFVPGVYDVEVVQWNPVTGMPVDPEVPVTPNPQPLVVDYEVADEPDFADPSIIVNGAGSYTLDFVVGNARGYDVMIIGTGEAEGIIREIRQIFRPDGDVVALNQPEKLGIQLNSPGDYAVFVRGFNPLDEANGLPDFGVGTAQPGFTEFPVAISIAPDADVPCDPPAAPQNLLPKEGDFIALSDDGNETSATITRVLSWDPVPGASAYYVYLSASTAPPICNYQRVVNANRLEVELPAGSYTYYVAAENSCAEGNYGAWSLAQHFVVAESLEGPVITAVDAAGAVTLANGSAVPTAVRVWHYSDEEGDGSWVDLGELAVEGGVIQGWPNLPSGTNYFLITPIGENAEGSASLFTVDVPDND